MNLLARTGKKINCKIKKFTVQLIVELIIKNTLNTGHLVEFRKNESSAGIFVK